MREWMAMIFRCQKGFEKELDFLIKHPEYAIVSCNMQYFDAQGIFMTGKAKENQV